MRVAVFIDGKNLNRSRYTQQVGLIDFHLLLTWLCEQVGSGRDQLRAAYYFTGVEPEGAQNGLRGFLHSLDRITGMFVRTSEREPRQRNCQYCGQSHQYTEEKEIDVAIGVQMVAMAARNLFDIAILVSGDRDLRPAVNCTRESFGKRVFVASLNGQGLSEKLLTSCYGHINMMEGLGFFADDTETDDLPAQPEPSEEIPPTSEGQVSKKGLLDLVSQTLSPNLTDAENLFLKEIRKAEIQFRNGGYVGLSMFMSNWRGRGMPGTYSEKSELLNQLVEKNLVEIYDAPDGSKAIRTTN